MGARLPGPGAARARFAGRRRPPAPGPLRGHEHGGGDAQPRPASIRPAPGPFAAGARHVNDPHDHASVPRFCSSCGGPLAPRRIKEGEPERPVCARCGHVVYLDPKVAVGTVITDGRGRFALVRRAIEPGYGKWVFPGGYVDRGELPVVAAVREAREEACLDVRLDGLINVYAYAGAAPIVIVYKASVVGGTLEAADESLEAAWFAPDDVPWPDLAFRSTRDALRDHRRGLLHPDLL